MTRKKMESSWVQSKVASLWIQFDSMASHSKFWVYIIYTAGCRREKRAYLPYYIYIFNWLTFAIRNVYKWAGLTGVPKNIFLYVFILLVVLCIALQFISRLSWRFPFYTSFFLSLSCHQCASKLINKIRLLIPGIIKYIHFAIVDCVFPPTGR